MLIKQNRLYETGTREKMNSNANDKLVTCQKASEIIS